MTINYTGIKAGLGLEWTLGLFISGLTVYVISALVSIPKVCKFIREHEKKDVTVS